MKVLVGIAAHKDNLTVSIDIFVLFLGDDWDDLSVKSGASSDDEDFVVLKLVNDEELPAFERRRCNSIDTDTDTPSDTRDIETESIVSSTNEKASLVRF